VETGAFDIFVDWLYEQSFHPEAFWSSEGSAVPLYWKLYVLADRLLVPGLKWKVIKLAFDANATWKTPLISCVDTITYLFENLTEGDPLLQLVVDSFCINDGLGNMGPKSAEMVPQLPQAYLSRVLLKLAEISKTKKEDLLLKREDYFEDE
jgi:hypothetical protein